MVELGVGPRWGCVPFLTHRTLVQGAMCRGLGMRPGWGLRPWFKPQHCLDVLGRSQSESESHSLLCKTRVTSTRPEGGGICELLDVEKTTIFSVLHKSVVSLR